MDHQNTPVTHADLQALHAKVDDLTKSVEGLVDAWNTGMGVVKFFKLLGNIGKWVVAVGTPIAALWAWHKGAK